MMIKNTSLFLILFFSVQIFSQNFDQYQKNSKTASQNIYLDSIKKTFVRDELASAVDSLWLKELTNTDLFNDISDDVKNFNADDKVDYELSTELLKKRLAAMDAKSPFNIEYNPGLENIIKSFLKNRKKSFGRLMAISEYYFPMFEEALAQKNVPLEIKYLAVVESALNPKAVSKMGATGLWQFMYHTGKQYKLNIDSYVDERSNPLRSSEAAAQYMKKMYDIFGDWDLVLASYNSGPGNVTKAIRRSGGQQNYWNIRKFLPQETQGYVPAFLATMYIYEYHKEHGIKPERALLQHFATDTIMIKKQMSFRQISDLLDVPIAQLQLLNPDYKMNVIPFYDDVDHFLRLPKDKVSVFVSNEEKIYAYVERDWNMREKPFQYSNALARNYTKNDSIQKDSIAKVKYYAIKRGDTLSKIANLYNVSINDLKDWNNLKHNDLSSGKVLKVSAANAIVSNSKDVKVSNNAVEQKQNQLIAVASVKTEKDEKSEHLSEYTSTYYVVKKGDNISNIAKNNNVTVAEIKEWNKLLTNSVQLGMSLLVSKTMKLNKEVIAATTKFENVEYIVKKGDNIGNIAKKFGSTTDDLKLWNNLQDDNIILGNSLIVAKTDVTLRTEDVVAVNNKAVPFLQTTKNTNVDYLVKKGDSLYSISKKYPGVTISDIKKWNNISGEELKAGMKLKING